MSIATREQKLQFVSRVFEQLMAILMGSNCAVFLANFLLISFEFDFGIILLVLIFWIQQYPKISRD